jgi:Chaperone for flagella basal body P-ring formation
MKHLSRFVALVGIVLAMLVSSLAGFAKDGTQVLTGTALNESAEKFVRREMGTSDDVHGVYTVPDKILPAGHLLLKPRWGDRKEAPDQGFHGRLLIPISILVDGKVVQQVGVTIQVGPGLTDGKKIQAGDPLTVILESGALRIEMQGRAQQSGLPGERIRVALSQSQRTLMTRIVSNHEVVVETDK